VILYLYSEYKIVTKRQWEMDRGIPPWWATWLGEVLGKKQSLW